MAADTCAGENCERQEDLQKNRFDVALCPACLERFRAFMEAGSMS